MENAFSFQRIRRFYQRQGPLALLDRAAQELGWPARVASFGSARLLYLRLANFNSHAIARTPSGLQIAAGLPEDIELAVRCLPAAEREPTLQLFRSFLRDGARFVFARHHGQVAGFLWAFAGKYVVTFDGYKHTAIQLGLPAWAAFLGNGYIGEEHRMKGLYPHLMRAGMSLHAGAMEFYAAASPSNPNSLKSHTRLGFASIADFACVRILGRPHYFHRDLFRRRGWRLLAGSRAHLSPAEWCVK